MIMANTTNPDYVVAPSLEMYFVDKDTGAPLSSGLVYFYSDVNRTTLKPIFEQVDVPTPYSYVQLENPVVLSAVGTFQDANGNNVIPYYFPFDADGNEELYYIEVYSSLDGVHPGVLQFTREGWPPNAFAGGNTPSTTETELNYIPNGQFLAHNTVPATQTNVAGQIVGPITYIAQGGWTFERPSGSSATDTVNFTRFNSSIQNPSGNPREAVTIVDSVPASADGYKRLCIAFKDVNKFANGNPYTFAFAATSTGSVAINFNLIANFGTGGSPTSQIITPIGDEVVVSGAYTFYGVSFVFPNYDGDVIGTNDDDTIQIAIYFPTNVTFNFSATDFLLKFGDLPIGTIVFLDETDADMLGRSIPSWIPIPDPLGSDLYLPIVMTQQGATFDKGVVGKIEAPVGLVPSPNSNTAYSNDMPCDGAQYLTAGYSFLGIPYSRLQSYLVSFQSQGAFPTLGIPAYGTGANFATLYPEDSGSGSGYLANNQYGAGAVAADGTAPTGFTFILQSPGLASTTHITVGRNDSTSLLLFQNGLVIVDHGTGIGISTAADVGGNPLVWGLITSGMTLSAQVGTYFTINNASGNFYVWFTFNGAGSDPAPGGVGIKINLFTINDTTDVANLIVAAINGGTITEITVTAANVVSQNSWWGFTTANVNKYYVWYDFGTGTSDPKPASYTLGIKVSLLSSDNAQTVFDKTAVAINSAYFAAPNFQGLFLRGYDPTMIWDRDAASRFGYNGSLFGDALGTTEGGHLVQHTHTTTPIPIFVDGGTTSTVGVGDGMNAAGSFTVVNSETGDLETAPVNTYVNWIIKY